MSVSQLQPRFEICCNSLNPEPNQSRKAKQDNPMGSWQIAHHSQPESAHRPELIKTPVHAAGTDIESVCTVCIHRSRQLNRQPDARPHRVLSPGLRRSQNKGWSAPSNEPNWKTVSEAERGCPDVNRLLSQTCRIHAIAARHINCQVKRPNCHDCSKT